MTGIEQSRKGPLEDVKVVDFTWSIVGPTTTSNYFASCGATVVKMESMARPDQIRTSGPFRDNKPGLDRSAYFAHFNPGKYSATLNFNHPDTNKVAMRFVRWADIIIENFRPGTLDKWGLGYEELKKVNPGIIMLRTSAFGQTGPLSRARAYGTELISFSGFTQLTGWPDRDPAGIYGAYTDFITPHFAGALLMSALLRQRKTGKGLYIDLAQLECSQQFLAPAILEWTVNGKERMRDGNRSDRACPHGAYRCFGEDRWCSITVFTDSQWEALCRAAAKPEWLSDPRFKDLPGRKKYENDLDKLIESWTINYSAEEVMENLQKHGVPAGVIKSSPDIYNDPQFTFREHFKVLNHREVGDFPFENPAFTLSGTPIGVKRPSPCFGEHNHYVYTQLLGMSDDEFARLIADHVIE